jgi:hypothetical protein
VKKVRRSIYSYLIYLLAFLFCVFKIKDENANWINYYWVILSFVSFLILLRLIIKPNYFEIKFDKLIIYRELFQRNTLNISDIQRIKFGLSPFSNSYIQKYNGESKKFNLFHLNEKDLNILLLEYKIKIE